jgi:chemotaxis protein methyltransferase CheR
MGAAPTGTTTVPLDHRLRTAYLRLVAERYGLRLAPHQARDLDAAIEALRAEGGAHDAAALYATLAIGARPDLLETLAARLTVGETHFFRLRPQIDALRQLVLPDLIARRAPERRLRLWSAGCSSGEETYTLAILVREALPEPDTWRVELVGTDISRPALEAARRGVYGEWSFRDTPRIVRQRYFTAEGKRWRLVDSIRALARFAHLNLAADAATWKTVVGTSFDLILCRNVTIYFGRDAAQALYQRLVAALAPCGWLVLGPSDPAPGLAAGLDWVFAPHAVLWRRPLPEPPVGIAASRLAWAPGPARDGAGTGGSPARTRASRAAQPPARASARMVEEPTQPPRPGAPRPEPSAARAALERRVAAQPLDDEAHLQLGLLDLDGGAAERAVGSLRRATFLAPDNALAHYSLGRAWQRLGDAPRARAALLHARRLLAAVPQETTVARGHGPRAGDLQHAVAAELRALEDGSPSPTEDVR